MQPDIDDADRTSAYDELVTFIIRHMACEVCGAPYGLDDVQAVRHDDHEWALVATCPVCAHGRPVTAFDRPPYMRLLQRPFGGPIEQDEASQWTAFLDQFTGDMHDLLDSDD